MMNQASINDISQDVSLEIVREQIELKLNQFVKTNVSGKSTQRLQDCMAHTLLAPGKRFRPLLTILTAQALGTPMSNTIDIACCAEMVHTASLILDDLPCMDDAHLRRNRTSAHLAFGESTAILTAVALLNRAFGIISRCDVLSPKTRTELISMLSTAIGANGLIAGQIADLSNTNQSASLEEVEELNYLKTGALFDFSILSAAHISKSDDQTTRALAEFSRQLGLAFQLLDDVKDVMMSEQDAEKSIDRDVGKSTIVALLGNEESLSRLRQYLDAAKSALNEANITDGRVLDVMNKQFAFAYAN